MKLRLCLLLSALPLSARAQVPAEAPPEAPSAEPAPAPPPPTAAITTATATADTDSANTSRDAEAEAIGAALQAAGSADESRDEAQLSLYGFADFAYTSALTDTVLASDTSSFAVGKLNLYAAGTLGDDWRSLFEVRFMYLPNGDVPPGLRSERFDTTVNDYSDFSRPIKWGAIAIQRAWLEHTFHPLLTLRVGHWLTPYGIWNVDHGSPVIIGVRRPFVIGEALLPESQTGVEAYGSFGFGPSQVGYHLTVSNGRGAVDTYQDYDHNKAIGGRIFYKREGSFGTITVGVSGYRGKASEGVRQFSLDANGQLTSGNVLSSQYNELSLAADLKWEWSGLLLQSEAVSNDVAYVEKYRPLYSSLAGGPPGLVPDHRRFGVYGLTGYRTQLLGIMPFVSAEMYEPGVHSYYESAYGVSGGVNSRPTPRVVLKAQLTHGWFPGNAYRPLNLLDLQAAWSF